MAVQSLSSDLTLTHPSSVQQPQLSHPTSSLMTVKYRNKTYEVILYNQDGTGRQSLLSLNPTDASTQKIKHLIRDLLQAHEVQSAADPTLVDPTEMNAQGLHFKNKQIVSHDFIVKNSTLAEKMAKELSSPSKSLATAAVKAQDAWQALDELFKHPALAPSQRTSSSTSKQPPLPLPAPKASPSTLPSALPVSSPAPSPAKSSAASVKPPSPSRFSAIPISSTTLDLNAQHIDLTQSNWFEQIQPPRLKRRILLNILHAEISTNNPAYRFYHALLQNQSNPQKFIRNTLLPPIESACASQSSEISLEIRKQAESIYSLSCRANFSGKEHKLKQEIQAFMKQTFDKQVFYQYFHRQAFAQQRITSSFNLSWCQEHLLDNTGHFVQALVGWLDNT